MLYRILTEKKNVEATLELVSEYFDGFTYYEVNGMWEGQLEKSICIEISSDIAFKRRIGEQCSRRIVGRLCSEIRELNGQEAVLLQELSGSDYLI